MMKREPSSLPEREASSMIFVTTPLVLEITAGAFGHLASTS